MDDGMNRADFLKGALAGGLGLGALLGAQPALAQEGAEAGQKTLVAITHGNDDPNRAILALVLAQAAQQAGAAVRVWMTLAGADLAHAEKAAKVRSPIFHAFGDAASLLAKLHEGGAELGVCPPCAAYAGATDEARPDYVPLRGGDWLHQELAGARTIWL
ncbi:MAG: DsrE family protein [Planctomycetota bacterium]